MVSVILLESNKLFLNQNSTSIVHMMWLNTIQISFAGPHVPSVFFNFESLLSEAKATDQEKKRKPVGSIFHEVEVAVIVHRMSGFGHLEVDLVSIHVRLKFDSVFTCNERGFLVVVFEMVMHTRLVEVAWSTESGASDCTFSSLGKTTSVVAEIIHVVFKALLFKFSETFSCVRSGIILTNRSVTTSVSHIRSALFKELFLRHYSVVVGVSSHLDIIVDS